MNNIPEYLKWRGDIPFNQVPYNEVDAYVLAKAGVPDFEGIIPENEESISLSDAYNQYFSRTDIKPDYLGRLIPPILSKTLRMLPETVRYKDLMFSNYLQKYNEALSEQISALTITIPNGPTIVTFRGTDDTITGWKEDFLMAVEDPIPAQEDALAYLLEIAETHSGPLTVIGHSKGGNLAIYAAAMVPENIQERITCVYNFDGPGFHKDFWERPGTIRLNGRIHTYLSQHSMVGILLTNPEEMTICRSKKTGPTAHEAMFWEVMGSSFIREKKFSNFSTEFGRLIDQMMNKMSQEETSRFIDDFFGILTSEGAVTLTDLTRQTPGQWFRMLKRINENESIKGFGKDLIDLLFKNK